MKIYENLWRRKSHRFVHLFVDDNENFKQNKNHRITKEKIIHRMAKRRLKRFKSRNVSFGKLTPTECHPNFRKNIFLSKSPLYGRSIHTAESLEVGEIVLITKPFACAVDTWKNAPYCLTCHETDIKFITCKKCKMVYFCNMRCKSANLSHKFECGTKFHDIRNMDIKSTIQVVFEAMATFDHFDDLQEFVERAIGNLDDVPVSSNSRESRLDCILKLKTKEYTNVYGLEHARETTADAYDWIVTIPEVREYFNLEQEVGHCFLEHFIAHNVSIIIENGFRISLTINGIDYDRILIYDILSFLNHSCSPNLLNFVYGNEMKCISSQHVQCGEQLFITYQPFGMKSKAARQKNLNFWNFECHCERCEYKRDINSDEMRNANRLNKIEIEQLLSKPSVWTPQKGAYILRYAELSY